MRVTKKFRDSIFQIIDNQIKMDGPAETALTLKRLMKNGYSEFESKQLIGQALAVELFYAMKKKSPYNQERDITNLKNLPKEPIE